MTAQRAETDYSFATFPPPDNYRFTHNHWIPQTMRSSRSNRLEHILKRIENEHRYLIYANDTLTNNQESLHQKEERLLQTLQLKNQQLHAAHQRIKQLEQEVYELKDNAVQMQSRESRLATCEQHMAMCQESPKENIQSTLGLNAGLQAEEQRRVPRLLRLRRSGRSSAKSATAKISTAIISGENATDGALPT